MDVSWQISSAAALIGDPTRAAMLWSLLDGESRPASELAMVANVSLQTASNHLKLLTEGDFVKVVAMGRNRFYSLSGRHVAAALESLAVAAHVAPGIAQRGAPELVFARTCYDHLAGELGVAIWKALVKQRLIQEGGGECSLTNRGCTYLTELGVDVSPQSKRRRFAYPCPDWSERVPHLGGMLGAALLDCLFAQRAVVRVKTSRAVRVTDSGRKFLSRAFAITLTGRGGIAG
jgi:DNA-binding transcriptional ArsR family regulator